MFAPNFHSVSTQRCPAHDVLLTLEGKLFVESCEVKDLDGEEAQQVVAACLADDAMGLAS